MCEHRAPPDQRSRLAAWIRLLVGLAYGSGPARLGRGAAVLAREPAAHRCDGCGSLMARLRRGAVRGVAREGIAALEVALPSSPFPSVRVRSADGSEEEQDELAGGDRGRPAQADRRGRGPRRAPSPRSCPWVRLACALQYAGTHEVAQFLGVSSQRVHQLAARPDA